MNKNKINKLARQLELLALIYLFVELLLFVIDIISCLFQY